jgi:hypothetical protein
MASAVESATPSTNVFLPIYGAAKAENEVKRQRVAEAQPAMDGNSRTRIFDFDFIQKLLLLWPLEKMKKQPYTLKL